MVSEYPKIKPVFPVPLLLSFRRNKYLKDILVRSSFTQPSNKPSTALGKPNHRSGLIRPAINSDKVTNKKSGRTCFSQKGDCTSSDVVDATECTKHQLLYSAVGSRGSMCPTPTFLENAVVTLENNAAPKNFLCHAPPPPQIQFPSYGSAICWIHHTSTPPSFQ